MKNRVVDYVLLTAAIVLSLGPVILFLGRCFPAFFVDSIDLGDGALFQIGVLDAATFDRFLGPYSRFGFNHPGPAPFYMLLPFFLAGGQTTGSLAIGAVVCNFLWLVFIVWTIRKTWGAEAALFANLPLALVVLWMGPTQVFFDLESLSRSLAIGSFSGFLDSFTFGKTEISFWLCDLGVPGVPMPCVLPDLQCHVCSDHVIRDPQKSNRTDSDQVRSGESAMADLDARGYFSTLGARAD